MQAFVNELSAWLTPPVVLKNDLSVELSPEHKSVFEIVSRSRSDREQFANSASALLSAFQPFVHNIAREVKSRTLVEPTVGSFYFDLEREKFAEVYGGPRLIWRDSLSVKTSIGEVGVSHLQTIVQVEAIEDNTIRLLAGHFLDFTMRGQRLFGARKWLWRKEFRCARGSAELENEMALAKVGLMENCVIAVREFAEVVAKSNQGN